jgi:hypothetical protein
MSRTYHHGKDRRIRVRGIRRPTDVKRLARALIELEAAQNEVEAKAQDQGKVKQPKDRRKGSA